MSTEAAERGVPIPTLWSAPFIRVVAAQATFGFGWCLFNLQPKFLTGVLGVGPRAVGTVVATSGLAAILTITGLLRFIDRPWGRRAGFLMGSALLVASSLGYLFVDRFGPLVYVLQAGVSASYVLAFNATMALVTDIAPPSRIGQAFGIQSAANLSMNAVSSLVTESVSERFGWRAVFAIAAVAALGSLLVGASLPVGGSARPANSDAQRPPYWSLAPAFLTSALMGATYSAMFVFHQPYALSLGAKRLGAFFVGFTAAALLMRLGFGSLGDRIGHRRAVLSSLVLYSVVPLATAHLVPSLLWLYGGGFGLAHGVAYPTLIAFATARAPHSTRGRVIGVFSGAFNVGTSTGALTWGYVASHAGYHALFTLASATIASGIVALGLMKSEREVA